MNTSDPVNADPRWKPLYRIGGAAALFSVAIIPIQLIVFIAWGQPESALGWFNLFRDNEVAGLLAFEILFVVNAVVGIATALALYATLRRINESLMALATVLGIVEAVAFIIARPALEMFFPQRGIRGRDNGCQKSHATGGGAGDTRYLPRHCFPRGYQPLQRLLPDSPDRHVAEQHLWQSNRLYGDCGGHTQLGSLRAGGIGVFLFTLSVVPFLAIWLVLVARRLFQLGGSG